MKGALESYGEPVELQRSGGPPQNAETARLAMKKRIVIGLAREVLTLFREDRQVLGDHIEGQHAEPQNGDRNDDLHP